MLLLLFLSLKIRNPISVNRNKLLKNRTHLAGIRLVGAFRLPILGRRRGRLRQLLPATINGCQPKKKTQIRNQEES